MLVTIAIAALFLCGICYAFACRKPCYRIMESTHMQVDGSLKTTYIVQQLSGLFRWTWWVMEDAGGEFHDGSSFTKKDEAEKYIESLIYNRTKRVVINDPICADSVEER